MDRIKLGISSCLLGENVRYDGRHKLDHYLKDRLGKIVDWVGVCPEVECGLSVPREAMQLVGAPESPRLVTRNSNIDHTEKMLYWAGERLKQLEKEGLAGFIFKSGSPSCGLNTVLSKKGTGIFAEEFIAHFQLMPVEDEIALHNETEMKGFIERIFAFKRQGLYIHMPFCRQKCLYCDFYSVPYAEGFADSYISIILKQIKELDKNFSSIYIGGGTPSVLSRDLLDKLLSGLKRFVGANIEFTIEVNPESVDSEKLRLFLDKGVNRISIGVQSFDDKKLKPLGRIHNARQALDTIELTKRAGFKNISIDMILGAAGENLKAWQVELEKAVSCGCQHISCYSLSYEKDTPLFRMKENKDIAPLDDETVAGMYAYAISHLPKMGFEHYEVSNFAKHGFECSHNLNYWDNNPYIGLGPSAVSYVNEVRSENIKDAEEYVSRYKRGIEVSGSKEKLTPVRRAKETASLKIRTKKGIDFDWFKEKTGFDFKEIEQGSLDELFRDNFLGYKIDKATQETTGLRLTERGFVFADTVSAAFL